MRAVRTRAHFRPETALARTPRRPHFIPNSVSISFTKVAEMVEAGPIPYRDGVVRWRLSDLAAWVHDEFDVTLDETTVGRALRAMGYRKLSARPCHHAQDPEAMAAFKKTSPPAWRKSGVALRQEHP